MRGYICFKSHVIATMDLPTLVQWYNVLRRRAPSSCNTQISIYYQIPKAVDSDDSLCTESFARLRHPSPCTITEICRSCPRPPPAIIVRRKLDHRSVHNNSQRIYVHLNKAQHWKYTTSNGVTQPHNKRERALRAALHACIDVMTYLERFRPKIHLT